MAAQKHGTSLITTIIGIEALLVGAGGVFGQLQDSLNTIWGVRAKPGAGIASFIRARFLSFSMVLGIGFLLLISMALTIFLTAATGSMGNMLEAVRLYAALRKPRGWEISGWVSAQLGIFSPGISESGLASAFFNRAFLSSRHPGLTFPSPPNLSANLGPLSCFMPVPVLSNSVPRRNGHRRGDCLHRKPQIYRVQIKSQARFFQPVGVECA